MSCLDCEACRRLPAQLLFLGACTSPVGEQESLFNSQRCVNMWDKENRITVFESHHSQRRTVDGSHEVEICRSLQIFVKCSKIITINERKAATVKSRNLLVTAV